MEIEQRIGNGDRAHEVLRNEAYIAAFDAVKTEITTQWQKSPMHHAAGREKLYLMLWALEKVQAALNTTLETGKLARNE